MIRNTNSTHKEVRFDYDAMGHRIAKHVIDPQTQMPEKSTYYVLDAQGNAMNIYEHIHNQDNSSSSYLLNERNIYGSSRLGSDRNFVSLLEVEDQTEPMNTVLGYKNYELNNHLGDVLAVITDRKYPVVYQQC